jgi:hypothetical protein
VTETWRLSRLPARSRGTARAGAELRQAVRAEHIAELLSLSLTQRPSNVERRQAAFPDDSHLHVASRLCRRSLEHLRELLHDARGGATANVLDPASHRPQHEELARAPE